MLGLAPEKRRQTETSTSSASHIKETVLRKSKTSLNIVHPLQTAAHSHHALFPWNHSESPWLPQSIESLTGVSGSAREQELKGDPLHSGARVQETEQHPPSGNATQKGLRRRLHSGVWLLALQALSVLLLNTAVCVACAWLANLWYSVGNVFSGKSAAHQSDFEFLVASIVSQHWNFYWINLSTHANVIMPMSFVVLQRTGAPRASFLFCLRRLLNRTYRVYLLSLALLMVSLYGCRAASARVKRWKLEFYVCSSVIHFYVVGMTIAVRQIFREETLEGQRRYPLQSRTTLWRYAVSFATAFVGTSAKIIAVAAAGLYVQLTSRYKITGAWNFAAYTLGSMLLKMTVKELAKVGVMKLNVKDPRSIFVAVGLPTVLVDTQVRVMLQRGQNVNFTIVWTIGMAVLEIATRLATVFVVNRRMQHKERAVIQMQHQAAVASSMSQSPPALRLDSIAPTDPSLAPRTASVGSLLSPVAEFEKWRRQILAFQIAESYANMSAEYIAIGCSTSILYFYWNHPKYDLSRGQDAGSASSSAWSQGYTICGQIAVEVFVDFVSCALEISQGVNFQVVQKHRGFLGLFFTSIAVLNVQICSLMYLKTPKQ